jgi:ABC-type branched-subunit amino acid transport system ATPase component
MRIDRIFLRDHPPIRLFEIETSSNVVIIAGPNGSGKTKLKNSIVQTFRAPRYPSASLKLSATREQEESAWNSHSIEVVVGRESRELEAYLQARPDIYVGGVVQIDSNRTVEPVRFEQLSLSTPDPDDQYTKYSWYLNPFTERWPELVNKIYKKAANRDQKIAAFIKDNPDKQGKEVLKQYPDVFFPYQEVFAKLIPGKSLDPIDPKSPSEFHYRIGTSQPMPITTLSSGEQEVIRVAFNFIWKKITHSVILIDEPELHLHPSLTFRLIETLKSLGEETNQLILFTHSADLISSYYSTGSVFFIDPSVNERNQAQQLGALEDKHAAIAHATSTNLGLFAVGKRLIFVEGLEASVDRLVYHKIAQHAFPDSYVLPIGSVENILALRAVITELHQAIFGIDLFLIRDRDGLTDGLVASLEANQRFRCLSRRHVENYLLDADCLSHVATSFYLSSDRRNPARISDELFKIASSSIMTALVWNIREHIRVHGALPQPTVRNLDKVTLDELAKSISGQLSTSIGKVSTDLCQTEIEKLVHMEHSRLNNSLSSEEWTKLLPGKIIFARFCNEFFEVEAVRVREAYTDIAMRSKPSVFEEIASIFKGFAAISSH